MKKANMHVSIWASSLSRFDSAWSSLVTFYTVFGSKGKRVGPCGLLIWAGDERGKNRDGIVCAFTWAASFPGCALWIPLGPSWQAIIGRQMSFPADAYNKPITDADVYGCYVRSTSIHPSPELASRLTGLLGPRGAMQWTDAGGRGGGESACGGERAGSYAEAARPHRV